MTGLRTARLAIALLFASFAMLPTVALAATANETFSGFESGYPTACGPSGSGDSQSPFAGEARGTINGSWSGAVCHTPVSMSGPADIVEGGYFRLAGFTSGWRYVTISGTFESGKVIPLQEANYPDGHCTQVFVVSGVVLTNGNLSGRLVHYGLFYDGTCHVFSASLSGTAQLNY